MTILREAIVVERTIGDAYRYVSDFSTIEQWDPGVYRSVKATPGPVAAGTVFDVLLNVAGRESTMTYTMLEMVPQQRVVLKGVSSTLNALDTITFEALDDNRTKIIYEADLQFTGPLSVVAPLMKPVLNRIGKAAVSGLKSALSIGRTAPHSTVCTRIADKAVLPAALNFTKRGYYALPDKSLSEFMDSKTVVVTGPTSGIGLAAACEFARLGADLVLVGRSAERLATAAAEIADFSGRQPVEFVSIVADLALVAETRRAAKEIITAAPQLDVLVNNAGALFPQRELTAEGNERSLAINLLGPYVLIESLAEHIAASATHVINVVSGGMYLQGLKLSDIQYERGDYDGAKGYARAKRALVSLTEYWAGKYRHSGARFNSMHPGWAETPGVAASLPAFNRRMAGRLRDSRMAADTIVWLASASAAASASGRFWFDRLPRTTEVLPGTGVTDERRRQLLGYLHQLTGVGEQPKKRRAPRSQPKRVALQS